MPLREELLQLLGTDRLAGPVTDETSLIQSGLVDSVALFNLMLWIEEQVGHPVDPTTLEVRSELDTVRGILQVITRLRGGGEWPPSS